MSGQEKMELSLVRIAQENRLKFQRKTEEGIRFSRSGIRVGCKPLCEAWSLRPEVATLRVTIFCLTDIRVAYKDGHNQGNSNELCTKCTPLAKMWKGGIA